MIVFLFPPILAGFLGLLAHGAESDAAYLPRLRLLFLGAAALGYLGMAVFTWRRLERWRRWGAILLGLLAVRICYLPIVSLALLSAGWLEWAGRTFGAGGLLLPMAHYALACFTAAFAGFAALLLVAAVAHLKHVGWVMIVVAFLGVALLGVAHPDDRTLSPHPFTAQSPPAPTAYGPDYLDVAESGRYGLSTRALAMAGFLRHAVSPRSGWGGEIRDQMISRYRGAPGMSMGDRMTCLEAAMLQARRTSSRSPRE